MLTFNGELVALVEAKAVGEGSLSVSAKDMPPAEIKFTVTKAIISSTGGKSDEKGVFGHSGGRLYLGFTQKFVLFVEIFYLCTRKRLLRLVQSGARSLGSFYC